MRATFLLRTITCVALLLGGVAAAGAQEVKVPAADALRARTYAAPTLDQGPLTLAEAVRLTILFSPAVTKGTQQVESAVGRHRESRGAFDGVIKVAPRVNYIQQASSPSILRQQQDTRTLVKAIYEAYAGLTVDLRALADDLQPRAPFCPQIGGSLLSSFNLNQPSIDSLLQSNTIYQDTLDEQEKSQIGAISDLSLGGGLPDFSDIAQRGNFCQAGAKPDPMLEAAAFFNMMNKVKNVDFWGGHTAGTLVESLSQIPREEALFKAQVAETVATRARLAWERLGLMPVDEVQRQFLFDALYNRPFRSGLLFNAAVQMQSGEQNFKDKPFDPSFGGMGIPTRFKPEISAGFNIPLSKGRGSTATAAPERAAAFAVTSKRELLQHATSEEVLRTLLAYFDVVAMQDTLALAEESAGLVEKVRELTAQQVSAGDIPAAEMNRVQARAASLRALVNDARRSLVQARVGLAQNIGADAKAGLPQMRAADRFSTAFTTVSGAETLHKQAMAQRRDVRAVAELTKATEALDAGARADLRRVVDLGVRGGLSNYLESPQFKYLPDEEIDVPLFSCNANRNALTPVCVAKPGHSTITPVRFFDPAGHYRAIAKRWEPFVEARITIQLPFGNNAARGRAKQTDADVRARRIQSTDLERTIAQTLVSTTKSLQTAAAGVEQMATAVRHDADVVNLALQQFSARELTLIEALSTEEQVTQDRLSLVRQRQAYLSILARLKFETGELLAFAGPTGSEFLTFKASDFVSK